MTKKYYFTDIINRLEHLLCCNVGEKGFRTLLYGWRIKKRIPVYAFYGRDYMNETEIRSFSDYAGYDLAQDPE